MSRLTVCLVTSRLGEQGMRNIMKVMIKNLSSGLAEFDTLKLKYDPWLDWIEVPGKFVDWWISILSVALLDSLRVLITKGERLTIQLAAFEARDRQVTDPRDRIFAMLGLLPDLERSRIRIDYNSSPERVSRDTIVATWDWWSLRWAFDTYEPVSNPLSPSWVPDLSKPNAFLQVYQGAIPEVQWITKDTMAPPQRIGNWEYIFWFGSPIDRIIWSTAIPTVLCIDPGAFVNTIYSICAESKRASSCIIPNSDPLQSMEQLKYQHGVSGIVARLSAGNKSYSENNQELERCLGEILGEDWVADSIATMSQGRNKHHDGIFQFISSRVVEHSTSLQIKQVVSESHEAYTRFCLVAEFVASIREFSLGFSFFTTFRGCLGFAKVQPEEGDEIAFMIGMTYPAVLRFQHDTDSYKIIGLAFASGVINFKKMENKYYHRGQLPLRRFKIG